IKLLTGGTGVRRATVFPSIAIPSISIRHTPRHSDFATDAIHRNEELGLIIASRREVVGNNPALARSIWNASHPSVFHRSLEHERGYTDSHAVLPNVFALHKTNLSS